MTLQKFSLEGMQKIRRHICVQLILPPSEQQPLNESDREMTNVAAEPTSLNALGDLFRSGGFLETDASAPNDEGRWFVSTIDPAAAIHSLPGIALKPDVRLVTYLQRQPRGGMGVTWALPDLMSTTAHLETALEATKHSSIPPRPRGALSHVMEAIQGDYTSLSFMAASLLTRELKELGRTKANCRWLKHRLIAAIPPEAWKWYAPIPQDLSPKVKVQTDRSAVVEFFSCRITPPVTIFRHIDQYAGKSYRPKTNDQAIALLKIHAVK